MLLASWNFYVKCLEGYPRRLFTLCNSNFLFLKVLYFDSIINVTLISHKLNKTLNIINMCGPSNGKKYSRDSLTHITISYRNQIIIEGSITNNVSLSKVWSTIAQVELLATYFMQCHEMQQLADIEPLRLDTKWKNNRIKEERHPLLVDLERYGSLVLKRMDSNQLPIIL